MLLVVCIALVTIGLVMLRPFDWPEAVWSVLGASCLVVLGALDASGAMAAVARGRDVYLFLLGMMLLAELARTEGLFDTVAATATRLARGSATRLFGLVFAVGVCVTVFLSNDATAVVLTPAVALAARRARMADPIPLFFACAFVANAASFVLPISNPANLVLYGDGIPSLGSWLARFGLASIVSVGVTFAVARWVFRARLAAASVSVAPVPRLTTSGGIAAFALGATAIVLLVASLLGGPLGTLTLGCGLAALVVVSVSTGRSPLPVLRGISWHVVPLVMGLFVIVAATERVGLVSRIVDVLPTSTTPRILGGALVDAIGTNVFNNLPAGLLASSALDAAHASHALRAAHVVAVDLGPNFSVTGSLATILWLVALRREGIRVSAKQFLALGVLVTPPALVLSILAVLVWP